MWSMLPRPAKVVLICVVVGGCLIASFYLAWILLAAAVIAVVAMGCSLFFKIKDKLSRFEFEEID